jgi:Ca2+-binding RTX toxin-like protein
LEAASGSYGYLYLQGTLTLEGAISDAGSGQNLLYAGGNVTLNGVVDVDYILGEGSLFVNANTTATNYLYSNYWSTLTIANATLSTPTYYSYYSNLVLDHGTLSYTSLGYNYATMTWSGHGTVQNGSTFLVQNVSPGLSSGLSGVLQANNVALSSSFTADLAGNTAGEGAGQHDQLQVTGTVQVAGALTVNVASGYYPIHDTEYVLIDNDETDAISGTFTGLSEGALLVVGPYVFRVSYEGGDGNDVVLVSLAPNRLPVADAGGPYLATDGGAVTFNASNSSDPDGDPLQYRWDFDNDDVWDTTWSPSAVATHTWGDVHTGVAKVQVFDGVGYATATANVSVLAEFGDAPDTYATLQASNGARHWATGPMLGAARDVENDGQPNASAQGDDGVPAAGPDDEDGVVLGTMVPGLTSVVQVVSSSAGKLDAWVDFNRDGDFFDVGEQVFVSQTVSVGVNALSFVTPTNALAGGSYARFRLSSAGGLAPTGLAADGEVEDYTVAILGSTLGTASIISDPGQPGAMALLIVGTNNSDAISVKPVTGGNVGVQINPFGATRLFPAVALGRIIIQAKLGNDSIAIDARLTNPTLIYGEAGNDTIAGGSGADVIYGGDGADSLTGNAGDDLLFGEAGADRLYGGTGFDTFSESGAGAFVLTNSQLTIAGVAHSLNGVERAVLQGGTGADSFNVGAWTGTGQIDGTGGVDKLLAAGDVNFTLTNTQLTRSTGGAFSLANIEEAELVGGYGNNTLDASGFSGWLKLDGGSGNDVLKSGSGPAMLLGGAGNDVLQGGAGRTVQIGGLGVDKLSGGDNDDLLIEGTTLYDANAAALLAILNEWASPASYATRVAHLKGTLGGGLNGANKLTSSTVRTDTSIDTLTGRGGVDWYFAKLANPYADVITDRASGEVVN